jgi:hypothetical protein
METERADMLLVGERRRSRRLLAMFAPPICRRRLRNNAFRSAGSDEDGGNPANIAASGASIKQSAIRAERALASGAIKQEEK